MWCRYFMSFALLCLVVLTGWPATAGDAPRTGLLWLRSPLPAVFPLQVKTAPGHDYHLMLVEVETRSPALSAYIKGGEFFRVLVPPGQYRLRIGYGTNWHSEEALFGEGTRYFELDRLLRFETRGIGTKAGHLVDLRNLLKTKEEAIRSEPFNLCQSFRLLPDEAPALPLVLPPYANREEDYFTQFRRHPRYEMYTRVCE